MHGAWSQSPLYALAGFVVGILIGLTGIGGGSLMTPILILLFGIHPSSAVGTDLLYAAVTKGVGTAIHGLNHNVEWRIVGRLALGSIPATVLAIAALEKFGATGPRVGAAISLILGATLLLTAALLLLKGAIVAIAIRRSPDFGRNTSASLTVATGFVVGVLVSISSVGAGALGTTALMFLYPRLGSAKIVGSDIAHAVPLTLLAGLGHWWLGTIHIHILAALLADRSPGSCSAASPPASLRSSCCGRCSRLS